MIPATPTLTDLFNNIETAADEKKKSAAIFAYSAQVPKTGSEYKEQIKSLITFLRKNSEDILFSEDTDTKNFAHMALGYFAMNPDNHRNIIDILEIKRCAQLVFATDAELIVKLNSLKTVMQLSENFDSHPDIIHYLNETRLKVLIALTSSESVDLRYIALAVLKKLVKNEATQSVILAAFDGQPGLKQWAKTPRINDWEIDLVFDIRDSIMVNPEYINARRESLGMLQLPIAQEAKSERAISPARIMAAMGLAYQGKAIPDYSGWEKFMDDEAKKVHAENTSDTGVTFISPK